ncbi:MAG: hypothetical protein KKC20_24660 [Proteobacteria bacterium]|nr:hypothetical protein [Pseudomonadota bacterium]
MNWQVPSIWSGGSVWIIGGGPSLTKQFNIPEEIVFAVRQGTMPFSSYSEYMKPLHSKHIIGVNVAFMLGDWVDIAFFGDNGFFLKFKQELLQFRGIRVSCNPMVAKYDWCKYLKKDGKKASGISSEPGMVSWNLNSGAAAISVAANAGAKKIFLLGFDMQLDESNRQHWHNAYAPKKDNVKNRRTEKAGGPFSMHIRGFSQIKEDAIVRGIEIINVNPESKIENFPKMNLKEALSYGT